MAKNNGNNVGWRQAHEQGLISLEKRVKDITAFLRGRLEDILGVRASRDAALEKEHAVIAFWQNKYQCDLERLSHLELEYRDLLVELHNIEEHIQRTKETIDTASQTVLRTAASLEEATLHLPDVQKVWRQCMKAFDDGRVRRQRRDLVKYQGRLERVKQRVAARKNITPEDIMLGGGLEPLSVVDDRTRAMKDPPKVAERAAATVAAAAAAAAEAASSRE
jgi:chromosome segregation ATPase